MKHSTGLSRGNDDFGQEFTTTFGRNLFIEELLYTFVIGLARISILAFYWRIFGASIRFPCYVLGAITICWMIANVGRLVPFQSCFAE